MSRLQRNDSDMVLGKNSLFRLKSDDKLFWNWPDNVGDLKFCDNGIGFSCPHNPNTWIFNLTAHFHFSLFLITTALTTQHS